MGLAVAGRPQSGLYVISQIEPSIYPGDVAHRCRTYLGTDDDNPSCHQFGEYLPRAIKRRRNWATKYMELQLKELHNPLWSLHSTHFSRLSTRSTTRSALRGTTKFYSDDAKAHAIVHRDRLCAVLPTYHNVFAKLVPQDFANQAVLLP